MSVTYSNIVTKEKLREVQLDSLKIIKNSLINSFGPMGSNTAIKKDNALTQYTKDGHKILQNIIFNKPIEFSVREDLENLTRHIVKTVGDGTTSAIILASLIFEGMVKLESNMTPFDIVESFKASVSRVVDVIKTHKQDTTLDDIYKIAMISTNGNEEISGNLKKIYEEFGMSVFIDVNISNITENLIKIFDGMTLESGYAENCFINDKVKGVSTIVRPQIFVFEDPIDTPEMIGLLDTIIETNIVRPYMLPPQDSAGPRPVPTVILAPKLSRDMSGYMDRLTEQMGNIDNFKDRPPLLIVTNIYHHEELMDIARLCGAKTIKKYLDPKIQVIDIESGLAPTTKNIDKFAGTCDIVEADSAKTKFINPSRMKNPDGTYTNIFTSMVDTLESELKNAYAQGADTSAVGTIKRRINSLKANMVEYLVGGVSMADRDALRDLVEDAVLNCRSAAKEGFGYGANFEGLRAINDIVFSATEYVPTDIDIIIEKAYVELAELLYMTRVCDRVKCESLVAASITSEKPFNLKTMSFDGDVLSSINSDIVILETISKIVSLMFTCNQFLVQSPMHNLYIDPS